MSALAQEATEIGKIIKDGKIRSLAGRNFTSGKIDGVNVVSVLSRMGKVNAATTAQLLISEFKTRAIVFLGVAGAVNLGLEVGDIVVGEQTFQHDYGFQGEEFVNHPIGHLPEIGIGPMGKSMMTPLLGTRAMRSLSATEGSLLSLQLKDRLHKPRIQLGTIATGDQFIASDGKRSLLQKAGADVVEMEGAAVAQVGEQNEIPVILIRTVSDKAGATSHFDFKSFLKVASQNNAILLRALLAEFSASEFSS